MKQKVDDHLQAINEQLKKFPDPPPNPEMEVMKSLAEFTIRVKDRVLHQDFMNMWHGRFAKQFKRYIIGMKPKFNVREHVKSSRPVFIDLDGESPTSSPTIRKRSAPVMDLTGQATPKRQRGQQTNGVVKAEAPDHPLFPSTPSHLRSMTPALTPSRGPKSKSLMDIRNLINRAAIPGQPDLVSSSVHEPLFIEAAKSWAPHLDWFINQTFSFLETDVLAILDAAFSHLKNRAVYKESLEHMKTFIENHKRVLREQLMLIYRLETQRLFTTDDESLKRNKAAELEILVRHRNHFRIAAHNGEELGHVPKMDELTDEELKQEAARMDKELKKLGPDQFEQELAVAAYIRGYYLTAANRFVDYVSIHVMSGLLPQVASVIETYLHEQLGLTSRETSKYSHRPTPTQLNQANHFPRHSPRSSAAPDERGSRDRTEARRPAPREGGAQRRHGHHRQPRAARARAGRAVHQRPRRFPGGKHGQPRRRPPERQSS